MFQLPLSMVQKFEIQEIIYRQNDWHIGKNMHMPGKQGTFVNSGTTSKDIKTSPFSCCVAMGLKSAN